MFKDLWRRLRPHIIQDPPPNTIVHLINERKGAPSRHIEVMMPDHHLVIETQENLDKFVKQLLRKGYIELNDMPYIRYAKRGERRTL